MIRRSLGCHKKSAEYQIPYSREWLRQDLAGDTWEECQASRGSRRDLWIPDRGFRSRGLGDGRRSGHQPGTLGAATLRRPPSKSLALGRLQRGLRRQWLLFVLVTMLVAGAGVTYDLTGGVSPWPSVAFWLPLGAAIGLAVSLIRELSRNTVTSLSSFGKHRGYAILGAAPELTPRTLRQLPPDRRTPWSPR